MRGRRVFESDFGLMVKDMLDNEGVAVAPGVVEQLVMFCHTYMTQVAQSAQDIVGSSESITPEHVNLASELRRKNMQLLNIEELRSLAQDVNSTRLASVADRPGLKLPVEEECLLAPNYQVCENGVAQMPRTDSALFDVCEEDVLGLFEADSLSGASHSDSELGNGGEASDELMAVTSPDEFLQDEEQTPARLIGAAQASAIALHQTTARVTDIARDRETPAAIPQKPQLFGAIPSAPAPPPPPPSAPQILQGPEGIVEASVAASPAVPPSKPGPIPQEPEKADNASNPVEQRTIEPTVENESLGLQMEGTLSSGNLAGLTGGAIEGLLEGGLGALMEEDYDEELDEEGENEK
ncbi:hypothetical protein BSKO_07326 [Bryopsis sp. KO-2023]|nr:hypothetical protein BSKO_07326 [Bryopsis sp. KO-2023]